MNPVLLEVGRFKLYSFGTFIALGALIGGFFIARLMTRKKISREGLFDAILYSLLIGLIFARVGYYLVYRDQFEKLWQVLYFWQGGLLSLAGLLGGFLSFLYFYWRSRRPIWQMLDITALSLLIAWSVGKIGCHLSMCSIGRPATGLLAVNGSYPIDLFSSLWAGLLFLVILITYLRNRLSDGVIFFLSLEGLFLGELLIKTIRTDVTETMAKAESITYLVLIVVVYILFWYFHGPKIERKHDIGATLKNLVFRGRKPKEIEAIPVETKSVAKKSKSTKTKK